MCSLHSASGAEPGLDWAPGSPARALPDPSIQLPPPALPTGGFHGQRTSLAPPRQASGPEPKPVPWSWAALRPLSHLPPVCLDDSFGPDCSLTCDDCRNGGACLPGLDGCDCPEGWTGLVCNESEAAVPGMGRGTEAGAREPQGLRAARSVGSSPALGGGVHVDLPVTHSLTCSLTRSVSTSACSVPGTDLGAGRSQDVARSVVCPSQMSQLTGV